MAGVSTKEIKNRIRSMESTKQITKAMEMVAASKLRRAQAQVLNSRPYFEILSGTIADITATNQELSSPYLISRETGKVLCIVIGGDRGLAGGYNSNVLKAAETQLSGEDAVVLPIGKKVVEYFRSHGVETFTESYADAADISIGDCFSISKQVCRTYLSGTFRSVCVAYTNFESMLSQSPRIMQLLPLTGDRTGTGHASAGIEYEPSSEDVFSAIIPEYLGGVLYGALCESRASEQAARRTAMDNATQNAEEMISDLNLTYNRARQAAITQEITEIVAGS